LSGPAKNCSCRSVTVVVTDGAARVGVLSRFTTGSAASPGFAGRRRHVASATATFLTQTDHRTFWGETPGGFKKGGGGALNDNRPWEFKTPFNRGWTPAHGETGPRPFTRPITPPITGLRRASYNVRPMPPGRFLKRIDALPLLKTGAAPVSAFKCPSASWLTPEISKTVMASMYIRSHCLIRSIEIDLPEGYEAPDQTARKPELREKVRTEQWPWLKEP